MASKRAQRNFLVEASALWYLCTDVDQCDLDKVLLEAFGSNSTLSYLTLVEKRIVSDIVKKYGKNSREYVAARHVFAKMDAIPARDPKLVALTLKCNAFFTGNLVALANAQVAAAMHTDAILATKAKYYLRYTKLTETDLWRRFMMKLIFQD